jgi:DNA-binding protein H-NS
MANTIDFDALSRDDRLWIMREILNRLSVAELIQVREEAEEKRLAKLEDAKNEVIAEMKEKFAALGLTYDEVMGLNPGRNKRRTSRRTLPVKYRGPTGETWSGRGHPPQWLRKLEVEGHNREEYLVKDE